MVGLAMGYRASFVAAADIEKFINEPVYSCYFFFGVKLGEIAKLCNLSDVMFRKIFYRRFGMSPKKYYKQKNENGRSYIRKRRIR